MRSHSMLYAVLSFCTLLITACGGDLDASLTDTTAQRRSLAAPVAQHLAQTYSGNRNEYRIARTSTGHTVTNIATGVVDTFSFQSKIDTLQFADVTVNLAVADKAKTVAAADLKMLIELYVAYFNRVPDADGLSYWIEQYRLGQSLNNIAQSFYDAAVQYTSLTGYSTAMTNDEFVRVIYKNVLGRTGTTAPPDEDVQYWAAELASGRATKGSLIQTMLNSAHSFNGNATWGWVPQLLDNKVTVATSFAIQNGLNYKTAEQSISQTMLLVSQITSTDTTSAMNTITAVSEPSFNLSAASAVATESYAGRYTGTYGGSASGTFDLTIDAAGIISGTAVEPEEQFTISGSVDTSNGTSVMNIGGDADGVAFQGTINVVSGAISGTWGGSGESGTFSGSR